MPAGYKSWNPCNIRLGDSMKVFETPRQISKLAIFAEHHYYCWNSMQFLNFLWNFLCPKKMLKLWGIALVLQQMLKPLNKFDKLSPLSHGGESMQFPPFTSVILNKLFNSKLSALRPLSSLRLWKIDKCSHLNYKFLLKLS